jgi:hypothetical protein
VRSATKRIDDATVGERAMTYMYKPKRYLTEQVVSETLSEFEWPVRYTIEDRLPDGIAVVFPRCRLVFAEGFESDMTLAFLPEDTGLDETLTLTHVLLALKSAPDGANMPPAPTLINDHALLASVDKVKNGIRDLSTLVLTYLRPCLLGDFGWVEAYRAFRVRAQ